MTGYADKVVNTKGLTEKEIEILNASRHTNFGDAMRESVWNWSVYDELKGTMSPQMYGGVVAGLMKKEVVGVYDNGNERGKFTKAARDMCFYITEAGKERFKEVAL